MDKEQKNYRVTLPPVALATAAPRARELLTQARQQVGMIPNLYGVMVNLPAALA